MKNYLQNKRNITLYLSVFLLTLVAYVCMMAAARIYPFGVQSNLIEDGSIQYADFFAWLRNVLLGKTSVSYSDFKGMGGSGVALFAYYLSSPLNLLIIFFQRSQIQMFIFIITGIKIGLAGMTLSIFLRRRFNQLDGYKILVLSLAYGCCHYVLSQMTNIMWMDGVYMLPLMMLGVWNLVSGKRPLLLCASIGAAILFNWYTAYMNCLFIFIYFLLEEYLYQRESGCIRAVEFIKKMILFGVTSLTGVLLSAVIFFPTVYGLMQGKGQAEEGIFRFAVNLSIFDIFRGLTIGGLANTSDVFHTREICLYCGCVVLILLGVLFFSRLFELREKLAFVLFLGFLSASCIFLPLENVWNGFRFAFSYHYRFSYTVIMGFLVVAAHVWQRHKTIPEQTALHSVGMILFLLLLCDYINPFNAKKLYVTIAVISILALLLISKRRAAMLCLAAVTFAELLCNAYIVLPHIFTRKADEFVQYVPAEEALIDAVRTYDSGLYRMEQTARRYGAVDANGSMAVPYRGFAHYSSTNDKRVGRLLVAIGYTDQEYVDFYKQPVLPADSLFGLKYVISKKEYMGFERVTDIAETDGKMVFYNQYALPLAFAAENTVVDPLPGSNKFELINAMYSNILGREVRIFEPAVYEKEVKGNRVSYYLEPSDVEGILYGYVSTSAVNLTAKIDGVKMDSYSGWLKRYVFNVGASDVSHTVTFNGSNLKNHETAEQFYYLDMDEFTRCVEEIKAGGVDDLVMDNGTIRASYTAQRDTRLLLTVPYEAGWSARINGRSVTLEQGLDTFIVIPVTAGENTIELTYHVPWAFAGIVVSLVTTVGLLLFFVRYEVPFDNSTKRRKENCINDPR